MAEKNAERQEGRTGERWEGLTSQEAKARREAGERMKDAVRQVAADTGLARNELYDAALRAAQLQ